ncbi:MAG: hypothetical protein KDD58_15620, partial [Bdellovibrionales bacterium]|nr:hypothetical protein [Bdellovibrionales bacterium]
KHTHQDGSCYVQNSGTLKCMGIYSGDGSVSDRHYHKAIDNNYNYQKLITGEMNKCGLTTEGKLRCWGYNNSFVFGNNTLDPNFYPSTQLQGMTLIDFSMSNNIFSNINSCAIDSANKLYCWGDNVYGTVGLGYTGGYVKTPAQVDSGTLYKKISSTGFLVNCGITTNDDLKCWGYNAQGQVGVGNTTNQTSPQIINSGVKYSKVVTSSDYTCGLRQSGDLFCWGYNTFGQLGDGTTTHRTSPVAADSGVKYLDVAVGAYGMTCGVTIANKMKCWGKGVLGDGVTTLSSTAVDVDAMTDYKNVQAGIVGKYFCGVTTSDQLKCWGENKFSGKNPKNYNSYIYLPRQ